MLYELRIYQIAEGRRKDIEDLFEKTNLPNFAKHGIEVVDLFFAADDKSTLYYILGFEDIADKEKKWAEFYAEPSWQADIQEFQKKGDIVLKYDSYLMERVPFFAKV